MPTPLELVTAKAVLSPLWWLKRWTPRAVPTRYADYHQQLIDLPEPGHAQMRCVFRGAAKTTVTRGLVIHCAVSDHVPVKGIVLVRATFGDAKADSEAIVTMAGLSGHPTEVDGEKKMVVVNGVPIWFRTPGGTVRGINWTNPDTGEVVRPNLAVVDDLETRESARSKMQTDKIRDWLFSDLMQAGGQGNPMRTVMLGTPITPSCLIAQAMRGTAPFDTWDTPMVVPIVNEDGVPAWPDNFNPAWADLIPEVTKATEFMLDPLPPGTLLFPPSKTVWRDLPPSATHEVAVAVDPAGDGEDATVAVAMCMTVRGLHVVDVLHHTGSAENAPGEIARFTRKVQAAGWLVIGLMFEGVGAWEFMARETARQVAPLRISKAVPKVSKVERALPLTVWHKAGALSASPHLHGTVWDTEFHSFDQDGQTVTQHDDCTDATAWAAANRTRVGNSPPWTATPPTQTP